MKGYFKNIQEIESHSGKCTLDQRWHDVRRNAEFKSTDRVLDVGCAEGLISFEVAKLVSYVHAIDDKADRVNAAELIKKSRGVSNVDFECASIVDYELLPLAFDTILFLGVFQHLDQSLQIVSLKKILQASKHQVVIRTAFGEKARSPFAAEIIPQCQTEGFKTSLYPNAGPGGDLLVATRAFHT